MALGWSKEEAEGLMQQMLIEAGNLASTESGGKSEALDTGVILQPIFSGLSSDHLIGVDWHSRQPYPIK